MEKVGGIPDTFTRYTECIEAKPERIVLAVYLESIQAKDDGPVYFNLLALDQYDPVPFRPAYEAPRTTLIWAQDGVCKLPSDPWPESHADDPKEISWLLEKRLDLGRNGWDQLPRNSNLRIESLAGANHFTIVRQPQRGNWWRSLQTPCPREFLSNVVLWGLPKEERV
ncbi:hypothetical protein BDW59DRAFT_165471 [Aspergillus cavernicola]|uniref:Uncharacterized protein n=1 Tax=Aspergillus cavernicola TaxID=176166 RepID=A0ABR4HSQ7_9EURO